jgi:protein-disulfide isomerase
MMALMKSLLAPCTILLALACSTPAKQAAGQTPGDVAARIGDRTITLQEVDARWRRDNPTDQAQAVQRLYDGRRDALDAILADMLIEQAAKAKGVAPDQFAASEIASRVTPVTDGHVVEFFEQNRSQMQGQGLEAMTPAIRRYLEDQRRAAAHRALVAELRKTGPPIRLVLDPPRQEVAVAADDPALGGSGAAVTLIEFSDFQCPFCARVVPTLKQVHAAYGDRVQIVWKDFPLTSIHPLAFKAAEAGQCAREQNKFWEYHDQLFANQQALEPESLKKYAVAAGLDAPKFNACLDSAKFASRVQGQIEAGNELGVSSTPSIFINGRLISGAQPYEVFTAIIDEELERAKNK